MGFRSNEHFCGGNWRYHIDLCVKQGGIFALWVRQQFRLIFQLSINYRAEFQPSLYPKNPKLYNQNRAKNPQMNIFIFHRDLRLIDNTTLIKQLKSFNFVTPIFIFPPAQIDPKVNKYFSHHSVQFMIQSLKELSAQIGSLGGKLYFFKGDNLEVLKQIQKANKINSIGYNLDYTPFAKKRDQEISNWAQNNKIQIVAEEDYGMYQILGGKLINKNSGKPYLVYTPFRNFCMANFQVSKPNAFKEFVFQISKKLDGVQTSFAYQNLNTLYEKSQDLAAKGGRSNALEILSNLKKFKNYNKTRNTPSLPTTRLSAHLHFTTVSIREVYHTAVVDLGLDNNIINEIHWRQFYMYITNYFPKVLEGKSFQQKFDGIKWKYNDKYENAWKTGTTGFPIVDAAMRELNTTGWMHNRCRMIVASFFAKDLFLDWHEGERYFASKLVDYSPMQNSGGWQWSVGNGTDAAPYFRIFNPWTQQKNYDEDCVYIKKWIPELEAVPSKDIHNWFKCHAEYRKKGIDYPAPMLDHDLARKDTLQQYNKFFKK